MTPEFLAALIDTLLPGDRLCCRSGTQAARDPAGLCRLHGAVFEAIAAQAVDADAFVRADESARTVTLQPSSAPCPMPSALCSSTVLSDY